MKIRLIAFSRRGCGLAQRISEILPHDCSVYAKTAFAENVIQIPSVKAWTEESFRDADAIIFIGAAGIAVREIAPFIKSKTTDPAVIAIDEKGLFVIPLLSGHIGGANKLSAEIAESLGSQAVITTATDINSLFSVDSFAAERGMHISSMLYAKDVSAFILERKKMALYCDFPIEGKMPECLFTAEDGDIGILISARKKKPFDKTLQLTPKAITLGIGCRKGTPMESIEELVLKVMNDNCIPMHAVRAVSSIDLKAEEEGLLAFCRKYGIPAEFYSSEELAAVEGDFTESSFVKGVTGIGNVCERAALKASYNGKLIQKKTAGGGVTAAAAEDEYSVKF